MKRILFFIIFVLVSLACCALPAWTGEAATPQSDTRNGSVLAESDQAYLFLGNRNIPPLLYEEDNLPQGVVVDLTRAIAREAGLNIEIEALDWATAQLRVFQGNADGLLQINPTPERLKTYSFSEPLLKSEFVIFKHRGDASIQDIESLYGKTVGVEEKGYPISLLQKHPEIRIVIISSWKEGFERIHRDSLDAVVVDRLVGEYTLATHNISDIVVIDKPLEVSYSRIAVKKENSSLLDRINLGLRRIDENGVRERILNKWAGKEMRYLTREQIAKLETLNSQTAAVQLTPAEKNYLREHQTFTVCDRYRNYPLSGSANGELNGIAGDLFRLVARQLGTGFTVLTPDSEQSFVDNVRGNHCDLISIIKKDFSGFPNIKAVRTSVLRQQFVAIGSATVPYVEALEGLPGAKLYVRETIHKQAVSKVYPDMDVTLNQDVEEIFNTLDDNQNSFFVLPNIVADQLIQQYGPQKYRIVDRLEKIDAVSSIGVNIETAEPLLAILDKTLQGIGENNLQKIADNYRIKEYKVVTYAWLWYLLGASLLLIIILQFNHIRQRARNESALAASERRFRDHSENSTFWFWEFDENDVFTYSSPRVKDMLGYTPEEIIGKSAFDPMASEEAELIMKEFYRYKESRKPFSGLVNVNIHKDGYEVIVESSGVPIFDEQGIFRGYRGIDQDITQKIKLEKQLQQANKMEAIGVMASGIAHNFNNALAVILGNIELALLEEETLPEDVLQSLHTAVSGAYAARDLIRKMMVFARENQAAVAPILFRRAVEESFSLLKATIPSSVDYSLFAAPETEGVLVKANSGQIQEILLNLCNNACQAMQNRGALKITLTRVHGVPENIAGSPAEEFLCLSVIDTGPGITDEIKDKIFDPFFTTKGVSEGTGMGLATVHGVVNSLGGAVQVVSGSEQGTTFALYFPVSVESTGVSTQPEVLRPTGTEHILVVDDEDLVLAMLQSMLKKLGYRVTGEANPMNALKRIQENRQEFDLVLTDQSMPAMTGEELAQNIRKISPEIPIVLCTGFSRLVTPDNFSQYGITGFCHKPVQIDELALLLRACLDRDDG